MNISSFFDQFGYYDSYYTYDESALAAGLTIGLGMFAFFMAIAGYVIVAILLGRIFKKAGVESWKAWVPFYNNWVMLELGGQKGFWAVLTIIPIVNIVSMVYMYIAMYSIGQKLGKEGAFVLWAIFLPLVWYIWLAVDQSTWKGDKHVAKSAKKTAATHKE